MLEDSLFALYTFRGKCFGGRVYFGRLPEGRTRPLQESERNIEGCPGWSRVEDFELETEFTRGLKRSQLLGRI